MKHAARTALATVAFWPLYWGWTLGCMLLFSLPWAVLVFKGYAPDKAMRKLIWAYGKGCLAIMALFARIESEDHSGGASSKPAIVVANHASFFDMHCLAALPFDNLGTIVRSWPFRIPGFGFFMRKAGYLNSEALDHDRLLAGSQRFLESGASVVFFPEGTRTADGAMSRFRSGAFHLAVRTGAPVVPVTLSGTGHFLRKGGIIIRPSRIRITALPPVHPTYFNGPAAHIDMMKHVKNVIADNLS